MGRKAGMSNHEENLTAYLDGELPEAERKELEAALEKDPGLKASLEQLRSAVAAVKALPEAEASAALRRAVLAGVDGPQTLSERLRAFFTLPRLVPIAGVAAVAALAVVVSGGEKAPADPEQLFVAQNMELLEDLDTLGLESPEDLDVVMALDQLEAAP
jgi:anti-sigma factor RsiW